MASNVQITNASASFQAVFALDIITAGVALLLLALATTPTFQRIRQRRFSVTSQDRPTPLKTTLGTYLFLWPALACLFIAYTCRFVGDLLGTSGNIQYDRGLQLHGRFPTSGGSYGYGPAVLSLASALAEIFFTVLLNGGVWIYSTHTMANGTGREAPGIMDKIYNAFIMLCILATGLASWGYGMSVRGRETTWASVIDDNNITRIIFVVYRCVVIAASLSVSAQVIKEYFETKANSRRDSPERPRLARFTFVVVPLIWLRNAFIVYDIVLLYISSAGWSTTAKLASQFLLIVFGQLANLTILGMILWGAWRTGRSVPIFDKVSS